jgi:Protein of unknown function (DUF1549)/Protein of unknown function (DUF1553)
MRFTGASILVTAMGLALSITTLAQQKPQPPKTPEAMSDFDKAHERAFTKDKAEEASRLTEEAARMLPTGPGAAGEVRRNNYIDDYVFDRMKRDGILHAPLSSDQEFLRRAYVDATGTLPTADEVRAFVASTDPAKRNKLVDKLVESEEFAEQFSWLWGDMLNQQDPAYNYWIKEFLRADRPYNEVVTDMMSGVAKTHTTIPALGLFSDAYVGTNSSPMNMDDYRGLNRLDTLDYFAIASSRVLLGMNTSCISCHDGAGHLEPVNLYLSEKTREEFWKSAAFHGKMRMIGRWDDRSKNNTSADLHLDELATAQAYNTHGDWPWPTASMNLQPRDGRTYEPAFLLTGEKPRPGENPRLAYARMITSHPQFRRAAVNIMWGKLMTVGFVEPYDGFDLARLDPNNPPPAPWTLQPTNAELLQALADDFGKNNFSLQHVAKTIMKSSAYQLSSHYDGEWKAAYVPYYARRLVRVMTGPELIDALTAATGKPGDFDSSGKKAARVKQLPGPGSVREAELKNILQSFFQSNRQTPAPVGNRASTLQALLLMSSKAINNRVLAQDGSRVQKLLESGKTNEEIIEELYLSSLSRWPTPAEKRVILEFMEPDRKAGAENLQWVLVNSQEFALNH